MNGELGDGNDAPGGRLGITQAVYTNSPRTKRYDDVKKATGLGYAGTSTFTSGYSSKYSSGSYRLASLDRLAYRQRLYESNGAFDPLYGLDAPSVVANGKTTPSTNGSPSNSAAEPAPTAGKVSNGTSKLENLQNKREMFFKSDSSGGTVPATPPITHPSTAPPAPPVSSTPSPVANATTINVTTNAISNSATVPSHTSIASIKEQLLTTKEKKDHKDEENKENKMAKELQKEIRRVREVDGYVGFANLPNQVYRKAVKKGFEFSLMVVGESGLGKSTLINSMFLSDIYSADHPGPSHRVKKTVQVETTKVLMKENGVNIVLTVVDTPGFGDAVDNSDCWKPIIDYIENKYEEYLNAESQVGRKELNDYRIHCCLYFIAAAGHGLKPLDIEFMRRLHDKVNIIPVIAKADTLTPEECQHLKKQVLNEIAQHKIKIYEFPDTDDGTTLKMKQRVPFAVVGSNTTIEVDGKKVRGRKYPWGIVEVENMEHCDFIPLRNMMIRTHMQDLKEVTNNVHYENFRCKKLSAIGGTEHKTKTTNNRNPIAQMEEEKREHSARMKKMEIEMEQVFDMKVKEKMSKLNELEADLSKRNDTMRKKVVSDLTELEEERERFEKEKKAWEAANNVTVEELRRKSLESLSRETVDGKAKKKKGLF